MSVGLHCKQQVRRRNTLCICLSICLLCRFAYGQTECERKHSEDGVFVCFPNEYEDAKVPELFHLSAQANAAADRVIRNYAVFIDGKQVYQTRLAKPLKHLSIETNIRSPFSSGSHVLTIFAGAAGSATVRNLQFTPLGNAAACDPFSRPEASTCLLSRLRQSFHLSWTVAQPMLSSSEGALASYANYLQRFGENLKSIEADTADAVQVSASGELYTASHSFADLEIRKYAADGSILYDRLIRACGPGLTSIVGLAVDKSGKAWIAVNTTACFEMSASALKARIEKPGPAHGFVISVDTAAPPSALPLYATYLWEQENRLAGIRVDGNGDAYLVGNTTSENFPHVATFRVGGDAPKLGFVSVLNRTGSALVWSTLLKGAELKAVTIGSQGSAYVAGQANAGGGNKASELLIAGLANPGGTLSYAGRFSTEGKMGEQAIASAGDWLLAAGSTVVSSSTSRRASQPESSQKRSTIRSFALALHPCREGRSELQVFPQPTVSEQPEVALQPSLDEFARAFPSFINPASSQGDTIVRHSVQQAEPCPVDRAHP